jgi:hypothetical protein
VLKARATFGTEHKGREQHVISLFSASLFSSVVYPPDPKASRACVEADRECSVDVGSEDDFGVDINEARLEKVPSLVDERVNLGRTGSET